MCIYDSIRFACSAQLFYLIEQCLLPGSCLPHIRSTADPGILCDLCALSQFRNQQEERLQRFAEHMESELHDQQVRDLDLGFDEGQEYWDGGVDDGLDDDAHAALDYHEPNMAEMMARCAAEGRQAVAEGRLEWFSIG